jgi:Ser/Thr protein kinase RdoA (MazF antagonist)
MSSTSIIFMDRLQEPIHFEQLGSQMKDLFSFDHILSFDFVHGGFMSQNFRVETDKGTFFLKQYRNRINTIIHEIKEAEVFFKSKGLPVIMPVQDKFNREAFWFNGHWYSLFPFVYGNSPVAGQMSMELTRSLARTLAKLHEHGREFTNRPFQMLRISTARKFHLEQVELIKVLESKDQKTNLESKMFEILKRKESYILSTKLRPQDLSLSYDNLLHGDYQYYNVFANSQDEVTHLYDLERACLGPTEYEVVRSMMMNCFDDGFAQSNMDRAREYLKEYKTHQPLSLEMFVDAMRLYSYNILHTTWIEARYLVFNIDTQIDLFNRHVSRLEFCATGDLENFCLDLFPENKIGQ